MSEPENFLDRWSRRKQQAVDEPAQSREATKKAAKEAEKEIAAVPLPTSKDTVEPVFDPASLPSLDSITADTDIGEFLKPGVPSALKHAALRRAWSADPQIRDFIGLVENGWNWNDPVGVPGFGPMPAGEDIGRLLAQAMGTLPPEPAAAREVSVAQVNSAPSQDPPKVKSDLAAVEKDSMQYGEIHAAPQKDSGEDENVPPSRPHGHGGALPK
ncbi:MAG TPA: DUF3306 domain-containing protein [Pseudolabrys sp.]